MLTSRLSRRQALQLGGLAALVPFAPQFLAPRPAAASVFAPRAATLATGALPRPELSPYALWYGTPEEFHARRRGSLVDGWLFGRQAVTTKVFAVVDDTAAGPIDVMSGEERSWLDDPFGLEDGAP